MNQNVSESGNKWVRKREASSSCSMHILCCQFFITYWSGQLPEKRQRSDRHHSQYEENRLIRWNQWRDRLCLKTFLPLYLALWLESWSWAELYLPCSPRAKWTWCRLSCWFASWSWQQLPLSPICFTRNICKKPDHPDAKRLKPGKINWKQGFAAAEWKNGKWQGRPE